MRPKWNHAAWWGILVVALVSTPLIASVPHEGSSSNVSPPLAQEIPSGPEFATPSPAFMNAVVAPGFSAPPEVTSIGPFPASVNLTVAVGLALPNPDSLAGVLSALYTPGTPDYRHFLPASEVAATYGPAGSTVAAASAYFARYGLLTTPSPDHLFLTVSGPSGRIAAAFGTSFEEYRASSGRVFFSHPTPATLPGDIDWSGAYGLGNVTPLVPATGNLPAVRAGISPSAGCAGGTSRLLPCQVWQAYNLSALISGGTNGSGERLAVVDPYSSSEGQANLTADLATFSGETGVPVGSVNYVYPVPASGSLNSSLNPNWALEDALDLEWARASAPGATLDMTFSPNAAIGLYQVVDWIVAHQAANVISMSWGEPDVGTYNAFSTPCSVACNASTDGSYGILSPVLAFAAAEGISVFAATGDCGAADGTSGVATNFPASDPDVTAVGGTQLNVDSYGDYLSETGWSGNSSGAHSPGCVNQGGSGGGYSPFPRPVWQTGLPVGTTHRGVPDVALDAATPVTVVKNGFTIGVLGTSLATPVWAGIAAIADQFSGHPLGLLNPSIYAVAAGANYSRDFHDILSGWNGYYAGAGWDPVTGVGTPVVSSLLLDLAHPPAVMTSDLAAFVYASPRFGTAPLSVSFRINATGGTGNYPLEGVYFGNGNASVAPNGSTTYTFAYPGVYPVQAYVADSAANYTLSPPVAVVVGGGSALAVNLTASTATPAQGAPVTFSVNVAGGVPPYLYNFSFGDGTFLGGRALSPTNHTYGASGSFCAAVVVSDSASPMNGGASARVAVGVGGAPRPNCGNDTVPLWILPNATLHAEDAPADFPVLFTAGGGSTAMSGLPPSFGFSSSDPYTAACDCSIFRAPGIYRVTGTAYDSENAQANTSFNVTVAPPLVGSFTASPTFGPAPLTVGFHVSVTGGTDANAATTQWVFGDGHGAAGASVTETYTEPGLYVALGHVSDLGDGNASEAFLVDVGPAGATSSSSPYLTGTISPAVDVPAGASVNFSARLVAANGSAVPALVRWGIETDSGAYRPSVSWTYNGRTPVPGATLIAAVEATDLATGIPVTADFALPSFGALSPLGPTYGPPRVNDLAFVDSGGPVFGQVGALWSGTASASGPGSVAISWVFGDGTQSTFPSVNHSFAEGWYTIVATATDSWGDSATDAFLTAAASPLELSASLSTTSGPPPLNISFRATASGGVGTPYWYSWTFGSNGSAGGANGTYSFARDGTYTVVVTATDLLGESATMRWTVTVAPAPNPLVPVLLLLVGGGVGAGTAVAAVVVHRRGRTRPPTP